MQEIILKDILSIFAFTINTLISGVWLLKKKKTKVTFLSYKKLPQFERERQFFCGYKHYTEEGSPLFCLFSFFSKWSKKFFQNYTVFS